MEATSSEARPGTGIHVPDIVETCQQTCEADSHNTGFFFELDSELQAELFDAGQFLEFSRGDTLIDAGDFGSHLFFILSGKAKVFQKNDDRQLCLAILASGDCFGELSVIDNRPASAFVTAMENGKALLVSKALFFNIMHTHPEFLESFLSYFSGKMRTVIDDVCSIALDDVYSRLRRLLYRLAIREGECLKVLNVTHLELSEMVGASREMISIIIKELRQGEYVTSHGKTICLVKTLPDNR